MNKQVHFNGDIMAEQGIRPRHVRDIETLEENEEIMLKTRRMRNRHERVF